MAAAVTRIFGVPETLWIKEDMKAIFRQCHSDIKYLPEFHGFLSLRKALMLAKFQRLENLLSTEELERLSGFATELKHRHDCTGAPHGGNGAEAGGVGVDSVGIAEAFPVDTIADADIAGGLEAGDIEANTAGVEGAGITGVAPVDTIADANVRADGVDFGGPKGVEAAAANEPQAIEPILANRINEEITNARALYPNIWATDLTSVRVHLEKPMNDDISVFFEFHIQFPPEYPASLPICVLLTNIGRHPNFLMGENINLAYHWTPRMELRDLLDYFQTLLLFPDPSQAIANLEALSALACAFSSSNPFAVADVLPVGVKQASLSSVMAPVVLHPHSCKYCEKIVFDREHRTLHRFNHDRSPSDSHDVETEAKALFDFTLVDLVKASGNGCLLCSWILDEECITLENVSAHCSKIANDQLRKAMEQAALWIPAIIPSCPEQTMRRLATEKPEYFKNMCLFLGAQDDADILRVEFFGLWDRANKRIAYRTRRGFRVQASEGNPAAAYITTRPIDNEPGSLETAAKISLWRDSCFKEHNDSCPTLSSAFVPKRLIKVQDSNGSDCLRLCETQHLAHSSYIPLSYCWGKDQAITLTTATVSALMESIPYTQLQRTLQDAITICRNLKVGFLWVDALCIIQDDDRDRSQQIAQMPQIYRNGYITIAAASASDASKGFLHKRYSPNSETPAFTLPYVCPNSARGNITIFSLDRNSSSNPLDTRAWTLQERLLSPRMLEFSECQVRWLCRGSLDKPGWTNGWIMMTESDPSKKNILPREVFNRVFDIARSASQVDDETNLRGSKRDWYSLVQAYTHRKLTRPTDRILALSGLAKEYSAAFDDEYLAGMWRKSLLTELLWSVQGTTYPAPTSFQGPSWSWTSVNGVIDFNGQYGSEYGTKEQTRAKVLGCEPMLIEDSAPFGAVEENLSSLTLEARLLPALLLPPQASSSFNEAKENYAIVMKMSEDGKMQQVKINIDTSDLRTRMPDIISGNTEIVLLELHSVFMGAQWRIQGLALRSETISHLQKEAMKRRLAAKEKKDKGEAVDDEVHLQSRPSAIQTAALRYQFRRYLGVEVDEWSTEQVWDYARTQSRDLLRMQPKKNQQRSEPEEQVFYRVGMFDYTSNFWDQAAYDSRARRECDWFKYCVPRVVKIL